MAVLKLWLCRDSGIATVVDDLWKSLSWFCPRQGRGSDFWVLKGVIAAGLEQLTPIVFPGTLHFQGYWLVVVKS